MNDMRRTLLWVVFTVSLFLLWDGWQKYQGHPSMFGPAKPAATAAAGPASAPVAAPASVPVPSATTPVPAAAGMPQATAAAPSAASEKVTVTTDLFKATIDSRGGNLVRLELLGQRDQKDPARNIVLFDQAPDRVYLAQTGYVTTQAGITLPNHDTPLTIVPGERTMKDGVDALTLRLESPEVNGVKATKTYTFRRGDHRIGVRHELVNSGSVPVHSQLYLQLVRDSTPPPGESSMYFTFTGPAIYTDAAKFQKVEFKHIDKNDATFEKSADNGWIAMVQHYFTSAWLVGGNEKRDFKIDKYPNSLQPGLSPNLYSVAMLMGPTEVAPGSTKAQDAMLFAGPQEENKLAEIAPGLDLVKDYGMFKLLAQPLFKLLTWLHAVIGNWGWAIVALVVILKAVFYWLNASAYRSMAKMKAINPRVMELRERHKNNPQQMQQEMMRIYKEEKVNPLGSCLPILVQMPFFIALYWVLLSSVEMRQAPWIGWIHDLSAPDTLFGTIPGIHMPIGLLPILMTLTSLLQTWLNPTPPDPVQAKMMWIMPLAFSVMFFFFPAGLVLYWLTNNILSIAQQYLINKQLGVLNK